jgi:dUTP pyrophosphatase
MSASSQPTLTKLLVKRLSEHAVLPVRVDPGAAGYDLSSAVDTIVPARGKQMIPTDLAITVPEGTYGHIAARSGLAWKNHITVGCGTVDRSYSGNVRVVLFNHSDTDFAIERGDRVAQLVIERILTPEIEEVGAIEQTPRGEHGFGSTGTNVKTFWKCVDTLSHQLTGTKRTHDGEQKE